MVTVVLTKQHSRSVAPAIWHLNLLGFPRNANNDQRVTIPPVIIANEEKAIAVFHLASTYISSGYERHVSNTTAPSGVLASTKP